MKKEKPQMVIHLERCSCGFMGDMDEEESKCPECWEEFYDDEGYPRKGCKLVEYTLTDKRFL